MASSGTITPDLLNSLLSPDAQRRSQGEAFLQTLSVAQRVQGFLPIVIQANDNSNNNNNSTHGHLAAVLLRRDILRMTESPEALVDPLLQAFLTANTTASSTTTNRIAIGHCLAEIAGSVAMLAPSNQERVMNRILTAIGNAVGQGDIASLRLLTAMAERAPLVFATTAAPSLENLIQQVTFSNNNNHNNEQLLEALMQLLVHAAIATQATQQTVLLPFTTGEENATIDPNSVAAALGRSCLPKLMQQWSSSSSEISSSSSSSLAMLQEW
ncbi:Importin (Partial), partial [Seminavis robusta]|eukprot:Sro764_g198990.1 Importin (269) ;mRNA; r:2-927